MKIIEAKKRLTGSLTVPGDKSISHRAVMLGSLAEGVTEIRGFLKGADCLSTISCFRKMGVRIEEEEEVIRVLGRGLQGLKAPSSTLDVGNSGTTARLISGILAGQSFTSILSGDASLNSRPMKRIIDPLTQMNARIESLNGNGCAPLKIQKSWLEGIHYRSPVASAQVKSCILLAGLYARGVTGVTEPFLSRDHTERMLRAFGADVRSEGNSCFLHPESSSGSGRLSLQGRKVIVPGDISSAAYFICAGLITPNSEILIRNVGINETRAGIIKVCLDMGGRIELLNRREESGEPVADILVRSSSLKGTVIGGEIIPTLIDELPVIAVMACFAKGRTLIRDAGELRVKESDRIDLVSRNLSRMGADITAREDGFIINGGPALHGAEIDCLMDHRIAMAFTVAGLNADGKTGIKDSECVAVSYPGFFHQLEMLYSD